MIGRWKAEWESKKKLFEAESGKKKPSEKYLGYFRKSSGVSSAFGTLDKAYEKVRSAKPDKRIAALNTFEAALKAAERTCMDYMKILQKEAAKESSKRDLIHLLKVLQKDMDACLETARAQLVSGKEITRNDGSVDPTKIMQEKSLRAMLKGAIKKAALWIQVVERDVDPAEFNKGIQKVTRDITQNLGNLIKTQQKGSREEKAMAALLKELLPWANGGKKLGANADFEDVIPELFKLKKMLAALAKV
ncbi:hypothetical protein [Roseibium sp. RKSG952]|uniref:hypothetical protein n=1 Tax=Roseibium sp. RKSG952 TaxID=2529384 RepID=UPI0012BBB145|nr:hypothetical protein [Roseibium sp. RKSG952]MTH99547.1 hypothetical protein [Roseibium sp. RKSG952]